MPKFFYSLRKIFHMRKHFRYKLAVFVSFFKSHLFEYLIVFFVLQPINVVDFREKSHLYDPSFLLPVFSFFMSEGNL